jgi:hypothetical protein
MKHIFTLLVFLSALTVQGQINSKQLDTLSTETKVFLFNDLILKSIDLESKIELNDSTFIPVDNYWLSEMNQHLSNRTKLEFFPIISDDYIKSFSENPELISVFQKGDEKVIRTFLVDHFELVNAKSLNKALITFVSKSKMESVKVEMASSLFMEGKIYVVVGVLIIIFLGIVLFLFSLQKKVNDLKKY